MPPPESLPIRPTAAEVRAQIQEAIKLINSGSTSERLSHLRTSIREHISELSDAERKNLRDDIEKQQKVATITETTRNALEDLQQTVQVLEPLPVHRVIDPLYRSENSGLRTGAIILGGLLAFEVARRWLMQTREQAQRNTWWGNLLRMTGFSAGALLLLTALGGRAHANDYRELQRKVGSENLEKIAKSSGGVIDIFTNTALASGSHQLLAPSPSSVSDATEISSQTYVIGGVQFKLINRRVSGFLGHEREQVFRMLTTPNRNYHATHIQAAGGTGAGHNLEIGRSSRLTGLRRVGNTLEMSGPGDTRLILPQSTSQHLLAQLQKAASANASSQTITLNNVQFNVPSGAIRTALTSYGLGPPSSTDTTWTRGIRLTFTKIP